MLWHVLWVGQSVLLIALACLLWRKRLHTEFPAFFAFTIALSVEQLVLYTTDLIPSIEPLTWWRVFWAGLLIEGILKFAVVGEIFAQAFRSYSTVARLGRTLIRGVGTALVLTSGLVAAFAPPDSLFGIVSGAHLLEQAVYLIETGLLLFIFVFAAYFQLRLSRSVYGIALGLTISACVHLATWAVAANAGLPDDKRLVLDFINMGTFNLCVALWFAFLLAPQRAVLTSAIPLVESDLVRWNRELERWLQQ